MSAGVFPPAAASPATSLEYGAPGTNRTSDARVFSAALYQLSYRGKKSGHFGAGLGGCPAGTWTQNAIWLS